MSYTCNKCGTSFYDSHRCKVSGRKVSSSDDDFESFIVSAAVGAATGSAILGALIGGDLVGGIIGDSLDGDLFD